MKDSLLSLAYSGMYTQANLHDILCFHRKYYNQRVVAMIMIRLGLFGLNMRFIRQRLSRMPSMKHTSFDFLLESLYLLFANQSRFHTLEDFQTTVKMIQLKLQ